MEDVYNTLLVLVEIFNTDDSNFTTRILATKIPTFEGTPIKGCTMK